MKASLKLCVKSFFIIILLASLLFKNSKDTNDLLSVESCSKEQANRVIDQMKITFLKEEPLHSGVNCFFVDETGSIAVGTSNGRQKFISVFDSTMTFRFAFSFYESGSFGVILTEESVWILLWREELCVSVTPDGTSIIVQKMQRSWDNTKKQSQVVNSTVFSANGETFELRNQLKILNITGKYSQIVVTHENGQKEVLYDVEREMISKLAILFVLFNLFVLITVGVYVSKKLE